MNDKTQKIKSEVEKADAEMKTVKEINYHKYNNYVMDKTIEYNRETKKAKENENKRIIDKAVREASEQIHSIVTPGTSFGFHGIDRIFGKK